MSRTQQKMACASWWIACGRADLMKDAARLDAGFKEIAPSDGLRKQFHHDSSRWEQFKQQYFMELDGKAELIKELRQKAGRGTLTLLFAARDTLQNNAIALKEYLER